MCSEYRPYQLSRDEDTEDLLISCSGLTLPVSPVCRVSDLLPLFNPLEPLERRCRRLPPLSGGRLPLGGGNRRNVNMCKVKSQDYELLKSPLHDSYSRTYNCSARERALPDMYDSYGRECHYSGSCVRVINDLIIFTGNDGKMRVSNFVDSESSIFDEVPGPGVRIRDSRLSSSRIFSLHPRPVDEGVRVLARHRHGVAVYHVTGCRVGTVRRLTSLPCSAGLASVCWTSTDCVASVDSGGCVATWDLEVEARTDSFLLPSGPLEWGWAGSGGGHHPTSVLVTDRTRCRSLDTRSGCWSEVGLRLRGGEEHDHVRHLDSEQSSPHCHLLTDRQYLLCDLRQPRAPVLATDTCLGRVGQSASWLWGRARLQDEDWIVTGDSWGQLRLSVLDWGHQHCQSVLQSDHVDFTCQSSQCPRVLGNLRGLGSWRDTIMKGRSLAGEWLDAAVEERAGLPFTGLDLAQDKSGNVIVYAVNAVGDIFGKKLHREDGYDYNEDHGEDTSLETDHWLTRWAEAVVSKSFLPQITLSNVQAESRTKLTKRSYRFDLPIYKQSKSWKERFFCKKRMKKKKNKSSSKHVPEPETEPETELRESETEDEPVKTKSFTAYTFLPSFTNAEWPEKFTEYDPKTRVKSVNIEAMREAMKPKARKYRDKVKIKEENFTLDKPKNPTSYNHSDRQCESSLSLVINKTLEKEEGLRDEIHKHILPHFMKLDLTSYYSSESSNENSRRILKIMLEEEEERPGPRGRRTSTGSLGVPSPAPPTEEDPSFAMASFWEDLGVDVPPSSQQSVEVDEEENEDEDFEL